MDQLFDQDQGPGTFATTKTRQWNISMVVLALALFTAVYVNTSSFILGLSC